MSCHLVAQNDQPPPPPETANQPIDSIRMQQIQDSVIVIREDPMMDSIRLQNLNRRAFKNFEEQSSGGRMILLFVKLGLGIIALAALVIRLANRKK